MLLKPMKLSLSTLNDQFLAIVTWKGNMKTFFFFLNFLFFGVWKHVVCNKTLLACFAVVDTTIYALSQR